jgi:hypothetical protein
VNVALLQLDGKVANLALMKIAAKHLAEGDEVVVRRYPRDPFRPLLDAPDLAYVAKVFAETPDPDYLPACETIRGGTGYDLTTVLPPDVESRYPAYDFFGCDFAMGYTSRGCVRRCPWCVVPRKEGKPRVVAELEDFVREQKRVMLLDPNLTALPDHFERVLVQALERKLSLDISQGIDARLLTAEQAELLTRQAWRLWKPLHTALDSPAVADPFRRAVGLLTAAGFPVRDRLGVYILVGFDSSPEEDVDRVRLVRDLDALPWVMCFRRKGRDPLYAAFLTAIKRWGGRMELRGVPWEDYAHGGWQTRRDYPLLLARWEEIVAEGRR